MAKQLVEERKSRDAESRVGTSEAGPSDGVAVRPPSAKRQRTLEHHFETRPVTRDEAEKANRHLLLAFATGNIPFAFAHNDHFRAFVSTLRPSFVPASRKTLAGSILDRMDAKTTAEMAAVLGKSKFNT